MLNWAKIRKLNKKAEEARKLIESAPAQTIPEGCVFVQQGPLRRQVGNKLGGTRIPVGIGTVGAKRLLDMLITHARDGLEDDIGSILFYECASGTRRAIEAALPAIYRDRVIFAHSASFPDGFGNDRPETVAAAIGRWGVPLVEKIEEVVRLHEELTGSEPADILIFPSLGGHAYPGVVATQELHQRLPNTPIFAVVNLPSKEEQRDYFLSLKYQYEEAGVTGWLIGDQMQGDFVFQDSVLGDLFAGYTAASLSSDTNIRFNNIATGVTGKGVGGMAYHTYRYGESVAHILQPSPTEPPKYYVQIDQVINEVQRLISIIESWDGEVSIDAPTGEVRRQTYDLVLIALDPRDVLYVRDYVEKARRMEDSDQRGKLRPHLHGQPNYSTDYTSWSKPIDTEHPRCQVAVIRLRSLRDVDRNLAEIVKVPSKRDYDFKSGPPPSSSNGTGQFLDDDFVKF